MQSAERGVLCADNHVGYVMPVGGVAAYDNLVSVVGVGFDIGCGNMAVRLNANAADLDVSHVLDLTQHSISFGIGRRNPLAPQDMGSSTLRVDTVHLGRSRRPEGRLPPQRRRCRHAVGGPRLSAADQRTLPRPRLEGVAGVVPLRHPRLP
jgi:hypothetical protein